MKIIIYNPNTNEWSKFIDSLGCDCKGIERDKAVQAYIVETGQEISIQEFVNNSHLYNVGLVNYATSSLESLATH